MNTSRTRWTILAALAISVAASHASAQAPSRASVDTALAQLEAVIAISPTGPSWREYLLLDRLRAQLARGAQADAVTLARIADRFGRAGHSADRPEFIAVRSALRDWLTSLPPPAPGQLNPAIAAAHEAFVPFTSADVARAKTELQAALGRLDARLNEAGPTGEGWRRYFLLDSLAAQLAAPQPDLTAIDRVYLQFAAGHNTLGLVWFEDARDALRAYLAAARAAGDPKVADQYRQVLDALPARLEAYAKSNSAEDAAAVAALLDWLRQARQAEWLVRAVRQQYSQPNFYTEVSEAFLSAALREDIDQVEPVRDCILGTSISGTGHATGMTTVDVVPDPALGRANVVFNGTVRSNQLGLNGPARIYSTGLTSITTWKPIFMDAEGLRSGPATSHAQTRTNIYDIRADRLPMLVERLAWRRAGQQKPQAERIAAQHAQERADRQADERAVEDLADVDRQYDEDFRRPLVERRAFPAMLHFSSTDTTINVAALQADAADLAAPSPPPAPLTGDLAVRAHESVVNNAATSLLGGMLLEERKVLADLEERLGELPENLRPEEGSPPWSILMAPQLPVSIDCRDNNRFAVSLRGLRYTRGEDSYPGMNVTAVYEIQQTPGGLRAVRQGRLEIFPPGFQPGGRQRLSVRQQVLRDLLERRFNKVFPDELVPEPLELKDRLEKVGPLVLAQWQVRGDWMLASWVRAPQGTRLVQSP